MLASGIVGIILSVFLGLFLARIIWLGQHGTFFMDLSPFTEYLTTTLNWWVPLCLVVLVVSVYLAPRRPRPATLTIGWCLHGMAAISLISLGLWVFTDLLPGVSGAWWMWWIN